VPPPEFEIEIVCGAGTVPPTVYVKLACAVEREIDGGVGWAITVSLTATVCGLFDAVDEATVIAP
jgi:hypothetical protein